MAELRTSSSIFDPATSKDTKWVLIGWSPRSRLLLHPEYAWLSVNGVVYLQLPQSRTALQQHLENSPQALSADADVAALRVPLGQWRWALKALRTALGIENKGTLLYRLTQLQRFASANWPGWYERACYQIRENIDLPSVARQRIEVLGQQAEVVAATVACRPLHGWSEGGPKAHRISTVHDALCYAGQGFGDFNNIKRLAAADSWWVDLEYDLNATELALQAVQEGECFEALIGHQLKVIRTSIRNLRIATATEGSRDELLTDAQKALENLIGALDDLAELRNRTSETINACLDAVSDAQ
jgi:hypothetical protein